MKGGSLLKQKWESGKGEATYVLSSWRSKLSPCQLTYADHRDAWKTPTIAWRGWQALLWLAMCLESENKLLMTAGALCLKSRLTGKCGSVRANEWELPRHVSEKTILLRTNYLRNEKGTEGEVAETICRCRGKYRKQSNEVLLVQSRDPGLKAPPYSDPHPLSSPETRLLFILTSLHHKTSFLNPYEVSTKSRYRRHSEDIYWPFLQKLTGLTLPIPAWGLWRDAICSFFVRLFCHRRLIWQRGKLLSAFD